jgi:spermidine/putrescine transport system substrate-binding protein
VNSLTVESASEQQKQGFYSQSLVDPDALIVLMPELDRRSRNGIDNLWNHALQASGFSEEKGLSE